LVIALRDALQNDEIADDMRLHGVERLNALFDEDDNISSGTLNNDDGITRDDAAYSIVLARLGENRYELGAYRCEDDDDPPIRKPVRGDLIDLSFYVSATGDEWVPIRLTPRGIDYFRGALRAAVKAGGQRSRP
jgi:hypothetical protein